jgi:membrane associated rhomboid family serine protease
MGVYVYMALTGTFAMIYPEPSKAQRDVLDVFIVAISGVVVGLIVGALQWLVLRCHVRGARWWIACMALGAAVVMQFHLPGGAVEWPIFWARESVIGVLRQGVAQAVAEVAFDSFVAVVSGAVGGVITGIPLAALLGQGVSERQSKDSFTVGSV